MRPDSIDLALIVHVLGAMVLVGALLTSSAMAIIGWNDEEPTLGRLSYKTLLFVGLPGFLVMRGGAEWVASKEHLTDVARDRLRDGRYRRSPAPDRADPRRDRPAPLAHRRRHRPAEGQRRHRDAPRRGVRRRRLGDGRQAELAGSGAVADVT
jgi:hypothetical protein